ncbi:MAG: DHA2 family efflux MFS transporter permease subunit [Acidimicrobiia bacterium]|nr:DHA2 family efflux MFS transporter permease subunit [Acidimicrobiia bacterium]
MTPVRDGPRWLVLAVLCLALLVVGIDGTIVNVALPTLVRDLHATSTDLQWIVDAYTIVFASLLLIGGNTGDRLGRKPCFIIGLIVFGSGSLGCALVGSAGGLIVLRGVQGFGAALIMPATLSILTNVFTEPTERARAIGLWAGVSGLGVAIGPLAGGFLLEHFWWGAVFLVNVPIVILTVAATIAFVPNSRDAQAPALDLVGTLLVTPGLIALLYGVIEGPARGWGSSVIIGAFVVAAVLLVAFVLWERRVDNPILDVRFFKNPRFTAASIAVTLVFFAMFGSMFFISQYLQFVLGYSALKSGAALIPVAGALMVAAPISSGMARSVGTKLVVTVGLVLVATALALFSRVTVDSGYGLIAAVLVIVGIGMGLAMAPATDSIMGSLPPDKAGVGSAMNDTTREIGGALGVAIMGSIANAAYASTITSNSSFPALQKAAPQLAGAVKGSIGSAVIAAQSVGGQVGSTIQDVANHAFVDALSRSVAIAAFVAIGGALVAFVFLPARAVEPAADELVGGAAGALPIPEDQRRNLATITLGLLADAGMSSLTYNAIASRSGISTTALEANWQSRVAAVTDALAEVYKARPVPDTGDVARDLCAYLDDLRLALDEPRARQVLGALISEAARDPELAASLRERVVDPRRAELAERLQRDPDALKVPPDAAVDILVGPLYHRALFSDEPLGEDLVRTIVGTVLATSALGGRDRR